jgi:hypothetical protein
LSFATFSSDLLAVFVFANLSCILSMRTERKPNLCTHKKDLQLLTIYSIPAYFLHMIHVSQCTGPGKGCSASWFIVVCFFLVIPRRLNFIRQRFGTLCLFHFHRQVSMKNNNPSYYSSYLPTYEDGTDRVFRNVGI